MKIFTVLRKMHALLYFLLFLIESDVATCYRSINHFSLITGKSFINYSLNKFQTVSSLQPSSRHSESDIIVLQVTSSNSNYDEEEDILIHYRQALSFLSKAALVGISTGIGVVLFKTTISNVESVFYEWLADILPKPVFYWPLALFPILGSMAVALLTALSGPKIRNDVNFIAQSIDALPMPINDLSETIKQIPSIYDQTNQQQNDSIIITPVALTRPISLLINNSYEQQGFGMTESMATKLPITVAKQRRLIENFDIKSLLLRLLGAVATLGSGCSLGPEGPAVEIGAGFSRIFGGEDCTIKEKHRLFLCGTAAAVSAGFNAPIAGIFFAIECGNRYLVRNTIKLDESAPDGPRVDIAGIVLAASIAKLLSSLGLHESNALAIQGNSYALISPIFELTAYTGLALLSGIISVAFNKLRDFFQILLSGESWATGLPVVPYHLRPILGGVACGLVAIFYPQTLFVGYATLDQLLAGKIVLQTPLIFQLLILKIILSSFCLGCGLIGGVFAPSLFMGAAAGTLYEFLLHDGIIHIKEFLLTLNLSTDFMNDMDSFLSIANAPAYATVGAAATLGSLFRAPLTSSMLMFELTQNHDIVLPVLISTGLGGLFAELLSYKAPRKQW